MRPGPTIRQVARSRGRRPRARRAPSSRASERGETASAGSGAENRSVPCHAPHSCSLDPAPVAPCLGNSGSAAHQYQSRIVASSYKTCPVRLRITTFAERCVTHIRHIGMEKVNYALTYLRTADSSGRRASLYRAMTPGKGQALSRRRLPRMRSAAFSAIIMTGRLGLPRGKRGHDRGIDHAQSVDPAHPQCSASTTAPSSVAHPARTGRMRAVRRVAGG